MYMYNTEFSLIVRLKKKVKCYRSCDLRSAFRTKGTSPYVMYFKIYITTIPACREYGPGGGGGGGGGGGAIYFNGMNVTIMGDTPHRKSVLV